jgi:protein-S-isoprenylcysteine O-methyltransferase Ste14
VLISPVATAETTSRGARVSSIVGLLFDRVLPAVLFGLIATAQGARLVDAVQRWPSGLDLAASSIHLLNFTHRLLALVFLALITVLFLVRRAPKGRRTGPLPMAVALLGTFSTFLVAGQPTTTEEWRVLGAADLVMVAGLAFTVYAAASLRYCFGLAAEARGLVTTGAYRLVRHPLYLGEFVTVVGMLLPLLAPTTVAIFAVFCLLQAARAILEERVLASTFAEYATYRRRTPALLPWPRP